MKKCLSIFGALAALVLLASPCAFAGTFWLNDGPDEWNEAQIEINVWTQKINPPSEETERKLGPWLDLRTGGIAEGAAQTTKDGMQGALVNGTLLPQQGPGFRRLSSQNESWGTGHMISLLMKSAAEFTSKVWPGVILGIGDISRQQGGPYPPHKSHQNGLDADVLFVGVKNWQSVLDGRGQVTSRFNPEMNWKYWRSLFDQKIIENGKAQSVISMILVAPEIKTFLCEWAPKNGRLSVPEDIEMMKRIRPTAGHDAHFHVRIRCSPHHPQCRREGVYADLGC